MITTQVIGSVGVSTSRQFIGAAFRNFNQPIQKLFVNGEQGFFYDPNDLSTMFQDSAGTTPVTAVGQPVGIILDKSKGLVLGPELFNQVINFSTWTGVSGGMGASGNTFTSNGAGGYFKSLTAIGVSPTKTYQVRIVGTCTVAHVIGNRSNNAGSFTVQAGDFDITVVAPLLFSGPSLYFYLQGTGTMTVSSISIKELAGNHAYQATSASRPILRQNATTGANYLQFDGGDDYFVVLRDNLKFLHDGTGATGFVGFKPSGATVYHTLLNTGNLAITTSVGYALAQDDRFLNRVILNMVANGSGTMHVNNTYGSGIASANPYVVSFKNQISTHALRLSGAEVLNSSTESGAPNTSVSSNHLWIGRSPSGFAMHGNLYGMLCVNRLTTASETLAIEKELAKRAGVTLNA